MKYIIILIIMILVFACTKYAINKQRRYKKPFDIENSPIDGCIYLPIGAKIQILSDTLDLPVKTIVCKSCDEHGGCGSCIFDTSIECSMFTCLASHRPDKTSVYFEEVQEDKLKCVDPLSLGKKSQPHI